MSHQESETIVAIFDGQDRARTIYPEIKARLGPGSMTVSMDEQGRVRMQGSMVVMAATIGGALLGIAVGAIIGLFINGFTGFIFGAIIGGVIGGLLFRWLTPKAVSETGATINPNDTSSRTGEYNQALNEMLSPGKSAVLVIIEPYRTKDVIQTLQGYDPERVAHGTGSDLTDVMHDTSSAAEPGAESDSDSSQDVPDATSS